MLYYYLILAQTCYRLEKEFLPNIGIGKKDSIRSIVIVKILALLLSATCSFLHANPGVYFGEPETSTQH